MSQKPLKIEQESDEENNDFTENTNKSGANPKEKKKYNVISNEIRKNIIDKVRHNNECIKEVKKKQKKNT